MNAKKILIWLVCLCVISMGSLGTYRYYNTKPTTEQQCFNWSIDACTKLIKENKEIVKKATESNIKANQQMDKLLSWTDYKFNSEKLNESNQ